MVLPSQEILVLIQCVGQMNFMTGRTELRTLVKILQECLFMECRLRLDELMIDPLEHGIVAESKWVVQWFLDRVISVPSCGIHIGDRMANRTGNSSLRRRMLDIIEVWIVKRT